MLLLLLKIKSHKHYFVQNLPIITNIRQKNLPLSVFGTTLPYPIVVASVPAKKNAL